MTKRVEPIRLSIRQLIDTLKESTRNGQRFCFILGSGASVSSGIKSGRELEKQWMDEIMQNPDDYERTANELKNRKVIETEFALLRKAWEEANTNASTPIPSEYYFDIYKLRFYPEKRNGYKCLEKLMEKSKPSIGYRALAQLLAERNGIDIVITTNFDSLTEDALFIYTDERPIVVAHESLADYIDLSTKQRPVIAKVHRGLFFAPMNDRDSTSSLSDEWARVLSKIFASYTPIVIGYAGGDGSLMSYLERETTEINGTMYWCLMKGEQPSDRIKVLVASKEGCFVEISGFDNTMLSIANELCEQKLDPEATTKMLENNTRSRCTEYTAQWSKWEKSIKTTNSQNDDLVNEVLKKARDEEEKREKEGKLSAQDYYLRGNRLIIEGKFAEAEKAFLKAIERNHDFARAFNGLGHSYNMLGKYNDAIDKITEAIRLLPDYAVAYNNRGYSYMKLGEYEKARDDFEEAIFLDPNYATAYKNLGVLWYEQEFFDPAEYYLSGAIHLKPDYAEAYRDRAKVYRAIGRSKDADVDEKKAKKFENRGQ